MLEQMQKEKAMSDADTITRFAALYSAYMNVPRDYGTGQLITSVEAHLLATICERPGVTVTELARHWRRTKGAISQIVTKLEEKGLIYREKDPANGKFFHLLSTEEGVNFNQAHMEYDNEHVAAVAEKLQGKFTPQELQSCFAVLREFISLL